MTTAVVIPYFQRTPGILRRALASVAAQTPAVPVHVIVVDDASPISAASEVEDFALPPHVALRVIVQPNGGPGAARNAALDALPAATDCIAFLDSDDEWHPAHLARARAVLDAGATAYFANHRQLGQTVGAFERAGRLDMARHSPLPGAPGCHLYSGDMPAQVMRANVIGTSTVVYACKPLHAVRFRTEYRNAGEDYLFWIELSAAGARWGFCTQIDADYGAGVNIFAAAGWGTATHFLRLHNEARYRLTLLDEFCTDAVERDMLTAKLLEVRVAMVRDLLHRLHHRKPLPWAWIGDALRVQPGIVLAMPTVLLSMFKRRGTGH